MNHSPYVIAPLRDKLEFDACMAVAIVMLVVDVAAAGWIGMWLAMTNRQVKQNVDAAQTVLILLFIPYAFYGIVLGLCSLLASCSAGFDRWFHGWVNSSSALFGLWFVLALAIAVGMSFWARRQLLTQFREMAAVQWGEPLGLLGQLGRWLGRAFRRR